MRLLVSRALLTFTIREANVIITGKSLSFPIVEAISLLYSHIKVPA
jgi:hypothetical protein